nr:winged helix-turn-helix domain-containing protein [Salipiger sp. HF18]
MSLMLGLAGAVLLTRWRSRANGALWWVLLSPMLAPGIVLGLSALVFWNRLGVDAGLFTIIMAQVTFISGYPMLILMARLQRQPVELEEAALDLGADDYLVKPFDQRELEARLRALVRRDAEQKGDELALGQLRYSPAQMQATLDGNRLDLTRREAALLGLLLRHADQPLSKERLYDGLFAFNDADVGLNAIELYIARLRKKLAGSDVVILTQRGVGYRITRDG